MPKVEVRTIGLPVLFVYWLSEMSALGVGECRSRSVCEGRSHCAEGFLLTNSSSTELGMDTITIFVYRQLQKFGLLDNAVFKTFTLNDKKITHQYHFKYNVFLRKIYGMLCLQVILYLRTSFYSENYAMITSCNTKSENIIITYPLMIKFTAGIKDYTLLNLCI